VAIGRDGSGSSSDSDQFDLLKEIGLSRVGSASGWVNIYVVFF
jgi:hypothetical protein